MFWLDKHDTLDEHSTREERVPAALRKPDVIVRDGVRYVRTPPDASMPHCSHPNHANQANAADDLAWLRQSWRVNPSMSILCDNPRPLGIVTAIDDPPVNVDKAASDLKPTNPKDAIGSDKLPSHLWP